MNLLFNNTIERLHHELVRVSCSFFEDGWHSCRLIMTCDERDGFTIDLCACDVSRQRTSEINPDKPIHELLKVASGLRKEMVPPWTGLTMELQRDLELEVDLSYSNDVRSPQDEGEDDKNYEFGQSVARQRERVLTEKLGVGSSGFLEIEHLKDVWPGGGIYHSYSERLNCGVTVTSGLSNADMPTSRTLKRACTENSNENLRIAPETILKSNPVIATPGRAGYGYELLLVTDELCDWPLWVAQWVCEQELLRDFGFLARVENYDGLTVEKVEVGLSRKMNFLFSKAIDWDLNSVALPNGEMHVVTATSITDDELAFSQTNDRATLLRLLEKNGIGKKSILNRDSVVPS